MSSEDSFGEPRCGETPHVRFGKRDERDGPEDKGRLKAIHTRSHLTFTNAVAFSIQPTQLHNLLDTTAREDSRQRTWRRIQVSVEELRFLTPGDVWQRPNYTTKMSVER